MNDSLLRVMRLWKNGTATAIWTGYHLSGALNFLNKVSSLGQDGRLWIDSAKQPSYPGYGRTFE